MSELRQRMIECLQLRGLSKRTQESYVRAVRQLAEHYHKSPELITEEELRQYFLYIKNVKHYSRSTSTIAICGIKFFFERSLAKDWGTFNLVRAAPEKKLPVILSLAEVRQILALVRLPRYRVCLTTIYSCGLRLQEGTNLRVADIDSARLMIHVRHGKGAKDRYVPLPARTLQLLRQYWKQAITPARTATAPSVRTSKRMSGFKHNRVCSSPLIISSSPSPCQQSCVRWRAATKRRSITCSFALPPLLCCFKLQVLSNPA